MLNIFFIKILWSSPFPSFCKPLLSSCPSSLGCSSSWFSLLYPSPSPSTWSKLKSWFSQLCRNSYNFYHLFIIIKIIFTFLHIIFSSFWYSCSWKSWAGCSFYSIYCWFWTALKSIFNNSLFISGSFSFSWTSSCFKIIFLTLFSLYEVINKNLINWYLIYFMNISSTH